jgi:SAM-dependent methyltransferase
MLDKEAMWIGENLAVLSLNHNSIVLNFGSQNQKYNKENKYLQEYVINPIKNKCQIRNLDLQTDEGIDYSGDLYNDDFFLKMKAIQFDCVLLCNVFEHVTNIEVLANRVSELIKPSGFIVFTGPYKYPVHYDPIDNGFRPEIEEVSGLFRNFNIIKGDIIKDHTYSFYLFRDFKNMLVTCLRLLTPFYKFEKWKTVVLPKFKWWNKQFEVTCVIMKKINQ